MRLFRHILTRKLTALLLVAVMLIIQGVQLLHRHPHAVVTIKGQTQEHIITKATHACAICDYHLAKDAATTTFPCCIRSLSIYSITNTFRPSSLYSCSLHTQDNRGPPALL